MRKPDAADAGPGDLGRRVAHRRKELGLTREETARRAGMAPEYLQYLEGHSTAVPSVSAMLRLASTLRTSAEALSGGGMDLPEGHGQAAERAELVELAPQECWERLSSRGVGRVAVGAAEGPVVVPVNYTVVDRTIAFRTEPGAAPAAAAGQEAAFEVDHIDEALSAGWSVLVRGPARSVTEPSAVRRLAGQAGSRPWAGGDRELWVVVEPDEITGRRIVAR